MADFKNKYGEFVYRIEGNQIYDTHGNWLYTIAGDHINDSYGNWCYKIADECLFDTHGNKIGEMKDLADILPLPKSAGSNGVASSIGASIAKSSNPPGCLGMLFGLGFFLFKANWGGRIGMILGLIVTIMTFATGGDKNPLNVIFMGLFSIFFLGIVGALIGAIVKFIIKLVKKNK